MAAEISEAEAKCCPNWPLWEKAIHKELALLKEASTWNGIGSKWLFHARKDAAGNIVRYKAHLIAQHFSCTLHSPTYPSGL
jgi:hypothetical protein